MGPKKKLNFVDQCYQLRLIMWVRQMAQRGRLEMDIFLYGNPKETDQLLGLDV
jgi:hypothetical protein